MFSLYTETWGSLNGTSYLHIFIYTRCVNNAHCSVFYYWHILTYTSFVLTMCNVLIILCKALFKHLFLRVHISFTFAHCILQSIIYTFIPQCAHLIHICTLSTLSSSYFYYLHIVYVISINLVSSRTATLC